MMFKRRLATGLNNEDLLFQAFTRSSYSSQHGGENNEVLEFLGDKGSRFLCKCKS